MERREEGQWETHMGVVDGDVGMQGLHICVLQPLYLELVLHVGPVYRSPTELSGRSGQGLISIPQIIQDFSYVIFSFYSLAFYI